MAVNKGTTTMRLGMFVLALALALDQVTKFWALESLWPPYSDGIALLPILNLRLGFNTGISFGLFSESAAQAVWLLVALKGIIVLFLTVWLLRTTNAVEAMSLAAIIGGALGNTADRIRHGAVVDFLDLHVSGWHWPTFNIADVAIVCGAAGLIYTAIRPGSTEQRDLSLR